MNTDLYIHNTLSRKKELFQPLNPPFVGMYVCGPTVYGEAHLGHARPYVTFDVLYRYLQHIGYKVRYVRNITDVGHLVDDADHGEDKIAKKARLEQLEPMEVVHRYANSFHHNMEQLNTFSPSIEPTASGHIIEQIETIKQILENGFAYENDGSIYFDVLKYNEKFDYGKLSGRKIDELMSNTRELDGQEGKRNSVDFALWKKAEPEHIMRWPSPWGDGFPGWHLECSVMSTKYLGEHFDIHGGGMDLLFPHHECEIAQSNAANANDPAKYWMHNNMITINGQKMGKSLGNFITLNELFSGNNKQLDQAYSPMTVRFFILQAHYRSTLDFSNEGLQASEKGMKKLLNANKALQGLSYAGTFAEDAAKTEEKVNTLMEACYDQMNDDINTAMVIASLFELGSIANSMHDKKIPVNALKQETLDKLKNHFMLFINDILGLKEEGAGGGNNEVTEKLVELVLQFRKKAKEQKDYAASDQIRDALAEMKIKVKDSKDGVEWSYE